MVMKKPSLRSWKMFPVNPLSLNTKARACVRYQILGLVRLRWGLPYSYGSGHCACLQFAWIFNIWFTSKLFKVFFIHVFAQFFFFFFECNVSSLFYEVLNDNILYTSSCSWSCRPVAEEGNQNRIRLLSSDQCHWIHVRILTSPVEPIKIKMVKNLVILKALKKFYSPLINYLSTFPFSSPSTYFALFLCFLFQSGIHNSNNCFSQQNFTLYFILFRVEYYFSP